MSVLTDLARPGESVETGSVGTGSATRDPERPPRWRTALAVALTLVVVACLALLVWLSAGGRASADGGLDLPDEREQVMSLTDQFVKRLGTYSPDMLDDSGQMPDYRDQVREVITPKFAADFDKEVATAEQLVAQGGITRTADVFATAVSSIDDDSARVLVAGAFTDSYAQGEGKKAADRRPGAAAVPLHRRPGDDRGGVARRRLHPREQRRRRAPGPATPPTEGSTP